MLQAWGENTFISSHGIRVDADGAIWAVDVKGHVVMKFDPAGRLQMILGRQTVLGRPSTAGNNESKDAFNEPTNIAFAKDGALLVSDGYVNSRVIRFAPNGPYLTHWGKKSTGGGEFKLVPHVVTHKACPVSLPRRHN